MGALIWILLLPFKLLFELIEALVHIGMRNGGRRRAKYWTHPNCTIHHRTEATANACKIGR